MTTIRVLAGRPGELTIRELPLTDFVGDQYYMRPVKRAYNSVRVNNTTVIRAYTPCYTGINMTCVCYDNGKKYKRGFKLKEYFRDLSRCIRSMDQNIVIFCLDITNANNYRHKYLRPVRPCSLSDSDIMSVIDLCTRDVQIAFQPLILSNDVSRALPIDELTERIIVNVARGDEECMAAYTRENVRAQVVAEYTTGA